MTDWFEWNGVRCTEYGVHVSEQPPLTIPAERVTYANVPGRSGSLTTLEGGDVYEDVVRTAQCFIDSDARVPAIAAWLRGAGTVAFANRPGGFYYGRVANQIPFERILRGRPHRAFSVNFRCKPFWYHANVPDVTVTQSATVLTNPGSVYAEPVLTVYGSGDIALMVDTTLIELSDVSGSITIDTPLMEAYSGNTALNDHMSGEFPRLPPGEAAISWTGDVKRVVVRPNWRSLA